MWLGTAFKYIAFKPMEAVGVILSLAVILAGAWLLSPLFTPDASTAAQISGSLLTIPKVLGIFQIITGSLWLWAIFHRKHRKSIGIRRASAMFVFLLYTFYGISGFIIYGTERITWLSTFTIAFIAAVKYLYLGVVGDRNVGS